MMVEMRDGGARTRQLLVGFALAHLVIFAGLFQSSLYPLHNSGVGLYFADMNKLFAGQVPYRDFVLEYPPFAIFFFAIPRLFGATYATYYVGFQVEIILCDLAILALLHAMARARTQQAPRESIIAILGAYTIFVLAVGPIVPQNFDLFAAALVLAAVYCADRDRRVLTWILLALGVMTKLYPLLLAPVFVLSALRRRQWKKIAQALAVSIATCAAVMLPLLVIAPTAIRTFFAYHASRGIQLESSYAALLLLLDRVRLARSGVGFAFGAWNVTGICADVAAGISTYMLLAALLLCFAFLYRRVSPLFDEISAQAPASVCAMAALVVMFAVLVTSKVLSPQYLIWTLPLVPLVEGARRVRVWILFAIVGVLTYYIFPTRYPHLFRNDAWDVLAALIVRNSLLVVLGVEVARALHDIVKRLGDERDLAPRAIATTAS